MKHVAASILVATIVAACGVTEASAQPSPERVAQRCAQRIQEITERGSRAIAQVTRETVQVIERLQADGNQEGAEEAAVRGARRASQIARAAQNEIRMTTTDCLRILQRLDADPALARRLARFGQQAHALVERVLNACLDRIGDAVSS